MARSAWHNPSTPRPRTSASAASSGLHPEEGAAIEELFKELAAPVALALEGLSVLVIAIGGAEAAYGSLWPLLRGRASHGARRLAWLRFARWLVLGLEFMLAADIVRTVVAPSWQDIGQLAAIAVIRTFLNFFLEHDLEAAARAGWDGDKPAAAADGT
jgi:uncharacterized membrane protein